MNAHNNSLLLNLTCGSNILQPFTGFLLQSAEHSSDWKCWVRCLDIFQTAVQGWGGHLSSPGPLFSLWQVRNCWKPLLTFHLLHASTLRREHWFLQPLYRRNQLPIAALFTLSVLCRAEENWCNFNVFCAERLLLKWFGFSDIWPACVFRCLRGQMSFWLPHRSSWTLDSTTVISWAARRRSPLGREASSHFSLRLSLFRIFGLRRLSVTHDAA